MLYFSVGQQFFVFYFVKFLKKSQKFWLQQETSACFLVERSFTVLAVHLLRTTLCYYSKNDRTTKVKTRLFLDSSQVIYS